MMLAPQALGSSVTTLLSRNEPGFQSLFQVSSSTWAELSGERAKNALLEWQGPRQLQYRESTCRFVWVIVATSW
eukprot:4255421-Amphidinium_carterae.1